MQRHLQAVNIPSAKRAEKISSKHLNMDMETKDCLFNIIKVMASDEVTTELI